VDARNIAESPADIHGDEHVDKEKVRRAFLAIRNARGDNGSPDLYIADPKRNALFIAKCRQLGLKASEYVLNKTLLNARKNKLLTGLESVRTSIDYEDIAFACEFAATELKYKIGVSIDDIVCDPGIAEQYDSIAAKLSPGHEPFCYRWAILSIRKASGRRVDWKRSYKMPTFERTFRLISDSLSQLPGEGGAYILYENAGNRALYARATKQLRHAVDLHRQSNFLDAIYDKFWQPKLDDFVITFAEIPEKGMLKPIERKIIEDRRPLFNVPRAA
jgi:site-specific DNA-methyltransferase (adenine-specific)